MSGLYGLLASSALVSVGAALLALRIGRKIRIKRGHREISISASGIVGIVMVILAILVL